MTLTVNGTVSATQDYAIFNPQDGTTVINGTVNGGIEAKAGTITIGANATVAALAGVTPSHTPISNGTSSKGYAVASVGNKSYKPIPAVEIASGATITGQVIILSENNAAASGSITSASDQVAIPADYKWEATENAYALVERVYVAQIGDDKYETLAEAVDAASSGDTIKLLAAVALDTTITLDKDLTLDLNGCNVTATDCRAFWVTAGTVAITGTGTASAIMRVRFSS